MIHYSVQRYDDEIEAAYSRLFGASEASDRAKREWQFESNPHGAAYFAVARDVEADGSIVGLIALVATKLRVRGDFVPALQAVDTIVDPAYRGRNIFVGLGEISHAETEVHGGSALWGFPNANAAPGWFGRLGWRNFGAVPFMFKPLRTGYFFRRAASPLGAIDLPIARRRRVADDRYRTIDRFDERATLLWIACADRIGCGVDRDARWLNWRLSDRPASSYRSVGEDDESGRLKAMVSTALLDKHGGRIAYVMEAMSASEDMGVLASLIRHEVGRRAAEGADVALCWCPPTACNRRAYAAAGFFPLPPSLRPIAIHFGVRLLNEGARPELGTRDAWYISYLDSDTV